MIKKMINFVIGIIKQIVKMCKNDVFYTLFFGALIYNSILIIAAFIFGSGIESYKNNGYYPSFVICKWIVSTSSFTAAYKIFKENNKANSLFVFGLIAIVYNPIFKIPFSEEQWEFVLLITSIIYAHFAIKLLFADRNTKACCVCGSKPIFSSIFRISTYMGGFQQGEVHYDGETYICKKCIDKCEKCEKCNQLKMSNEIKEALGEWETIDFCYCEKK